MDFERAQAATYEEQRVTFLEAIEDGPTLEHGYSRKIRWIPTGIRATFARHRHGKDWSAWRLNSGRMFGDNIRADGSRGAQHFERLYGHGNDGASWVNERLAGMLADVERYGVDQPDPDAVDLDEEDGVTNGAEPEEF